MNTYEIVSTALCIVMSFSTGCLFFKYRNERRKRKELEALRNNPLETVYRGYRTLMTYLRKYIASDREVVSLDTKLEFAEQQLKEAIENKNEELADEIRKDIEDLKKGEKI